MAKQRYLMIIEPPTDPKRELFGGWFPDLPGCFTAGRSVPHLRKMGAEAVSLYLWGLERKHEKPPLARHRAEYVAVDKDGVDSLRSGAVGAKPRAAAAKNGSARQITVRRKGKVKR